MNFNICDAQARDFDEDQAADVLYGLKSSQESSESTQSSQEEPVSTTQKTKRVASQASEALPCCHKRKSDSFPVHGPKRACSPLPYNNSSVGTPSLRRKAGGPQSRLATQELLKLLKNQEASTEPEPALPTQPLPHKEFFRLLTGRTFPLSETAAKSSSD